MDILTMITNQLNDPKALEQLSKTTGVKPSQTQQLTQEALPAILAALQQNATTPGGAKSLNKALEEHKDDQIEDILKFLKNVDTNDGAKILQHIFSGRNEAVQADLANKAGVQKNQVSSLLTQLAPLVLGVLGNQKKTQTGKQGDVMNLLGGMLGGFLKR